MTHSLEPESLTIEEALERFRGRTAAELKLLNAHLPKSLRLERREANRLVDDLMYALRKTLERRNASLFDMALLQARDLLVWPTGLRRRSNKFAANKAAQNWKLRDQTGRQTSGPNTFPPRPYR
jgi:hypothetical protein